ncbi:MAG: rRNA maturation RNase YbeY [Verrucomicrobiales bacterium]|nr:rRNA maturation RNase YbeY [Verrucomicrobiales bacterium]
MSKKIILTVINSQNLINFDLEYVKSKVDVACQLCVRESKESAPLKELKSVEISIIDDKQIAKVHGEFMDDPSPTDVITFDYGEILVSAETALSNSEEMQVSLENEILLYIIHGMLHLGGYLDGSRAEFKEMKSLQEMILDSCLKAS